MVARFLWVNVGPAQHSLGTRGDPRLAMPARLCVCVHAELQPAHVPLWVAAMVRARAPRRPPHRHHKRALDEGIVPPWLPSVARHHDRMKGPPVDAPEVVIAPEGLAVDLLGAIGVAVHDPIRWRVDVGEIVDRHHLPHLAVDRRRSSPLDHGGLCRVVAGIDQPQITRCDGLEVEQRRPRRPPDSTPAIAHADPVSLGLVRCLGRRRWHGTPARCGVPVDGRGCAGVSEQRCQPRIEVIDERRPRHVRPVDPVGRL